MPERGTLALSLRLFPQLSWANRGLPVFFNLRALRALPQRREYGNSKA
jgi:hypothetical protein